MDINNKAVTREEFIEKAKELAIDFWTMNLRDGTYESKFTELLDEYNRSCVDKDELISDLDDRRAVGVEMNEDMWYFCRKQSAEYLLDKYKLLRK